MPYPGNGRGIGLPWRCGVTICRAGPVSWPSRASPPTRQSGPSSLRGWLASRLPAYMVPHHIVFLHALPLGPTGKIDVKALPPPHALDAERQNAAPPRNDTERRLLLIWSDLLELPGIGIQDRFFDLNGHSLAAAECLCGSHKHSGCRSRSGSWLRRVRLPTWRQRSMRPAPVRHGRCVRRHGANHCCAMPSCPMMFVRQAQG